MADGPCPQDFRSNDDYIAALQIHVIGEHSEGEDSGNDWAVGGSEPDTAEERQEYAIEPGRGWDARTITDELATVIEDLPGYRDEARLITRTVIYGPWRYVLPEENR